VIAYFLRFKGSSVKTARWSAAVKVGMLKSINTSRQEQIFMKINKFLTVILSGFLFSSIIAADAANPPKNNKSKKNNTKQVFTIKEINLEMIDCPAGSFMMGSPENEIGKYTDEIYHKVNIS
jgi:formylglycine-generating enzyme required for sulfatase activity